MEIFLLNFAAYIQVQMHVMVRLINHVFKVVKTEVVDCCPLVDFLSLACIVKTCLLLFILFSVGFAVCV